MRLIEDIMQRQNAEQPGEDMMNESKTHIYD